MASTWLHPKSVNWYARYRGAEGKTINRSTGTPDRTEAERIAGQWEIEAAREREKNQKHPEVSPSGISDTVTKLERLAREGRLDPSKARDAINNLLVAAGYEPIGSVTSRAWCETWQKSKAGAVAPSSQIRYEQISRDWLSFLGSKADKPLESVTKADVVAFRDARAEEGLAPRTVNENVKLMRCVYGEALEQGHIGRNPFIGVDRLRDAPDRKKRVPFTLDEMEALIKTADGEWRGLILLAATSGMRLKDAAGLLWSSIDIADGIIRIRAAKNGVYLTLPIHDDLSAWLATQPRGIGEAPLFPKLSTKAGSGNNGLSESFKRIMKRAKISDGKAAKKPGKAGRRMSQKSFHSLRHFAASQMAAAGIRSDISCQITGHADKEVHGHYVTPDLDNLRDAVRVIRLRKGDATAKGRTIAKITA